MTPSSTPRMNKIPEDWKASSDPRRAAAAWHALIEGDEAPEAERHAFADWLGRSPAHLEEYLRIAGLREQLCSPEAFAGIDLDELLRQAPSNVEALEVSLPQAGMSQRPVHPSPRRWALAASVAAGLLGGLVWIGLALFDRPVVYTTAVGEQRSVVLPDGSIAELNTRSRLEVKFDARQRAVTLREGEALFRVARDARRPFDVSGGPAVIRVLGTAFNVRRDVRHTTVTVLEGRVAVVSAEKPGAGVELAVGERLVVASSRALTPAAVRAVDPVTAVAWKARRLEFDAAPLTEVVAEFNRYNKQQIRIEDAVLASRRVTGVFNANAPQMLVAFLQKNAGAVLVTTDADGDLVVHAPEK